MNSNFAFLAVHDTDTVCDTAKNFVDFFQDLCDVLE